MAHTHQVITTNIFQHFHLVSILRWSNQRYRIFFFPRNSLPPLTHSIFKNFVFFFSQKKIQPVFFFTGKVCKPLTRLRSGYIQKKVQNTYFSWFFHILVVFFFTHFVVFFFPRKSLKSTHSLHFRRPKKKNSKWKKKNTIFTHSVDFCPKCAKIKLFQEKKKYDTFGRSKVLLSHRGREILGPMQLLYLRNYMCYFWYYQERSRYIH